MSVPEEWLLKITHHEHYLFSPQAIPEGEKLQFPNRHSRCSQKKKKVDEREREQYEKHAIQCFFFSFIKDELQPICLPSENISQSDTVWTPTDCSSSALIKESQELFSPFNLLLQLIPIDWEGQKMGM